MTERLLQKTFCDILRMKFRQNIREVIGIGEAVTCSVGAELSLVMNVVPNDRVVLSRSGAASNCEYQSPLPGYDKQSEHFATVFVVWQVALAREAARRVVLARIRVLQACNTNISIN